MAHRELLGYINCPVCGYVNGMRITEDKNGNPFGYCEAKCSQQLPVGNGGEDRIYSFYETYPHITKAEKHRVKEADKPETESASLPVTVTEEPQKPKQETQPKKSDNRYLAILGVE